jgi:hypothetical protein
MKEGLILIEKFQDFNKTDIESAINELKKITIERNRVHLQKLVYSDLVNRFDVLVDSLIMEFSKSKGIFNESVLEGMRETPVFRKDLYEIFLVEDPKKIVIQRI